MTAPLIAQQFSFASFGQADGLANLHVTAIVQDQTGFIWVGTEHGLYRYSGGSFISFSGRSGLTNQYIYALFVDRSNRLWVGTDNGLFVTNDTLRPGFVRVGSRQMVIVGANSAFTNESAFAQLSNGDLLAVANNGLWEIAGTPAGWQAEPYFIRHSMAPAPATVSGILVTRDGALWIGCGSELCQIQGGQLHRWGVNRGVVAGRWAELFQDRSGTLWARDSTKIIALTPNADTFEPRMKGLGLNPPSVSYLAFAQDRSGRVLTLLASGLARWSPNRTGDGGTGMGEGIWERLGAEAGMPTAPISALCVAQDGAPWVGVLGRGVRRWLGYDSIRSWAPQAGLASPIVWSILPIAPGKVLIATEKGVDALNTVSGRITPWGPWRSHQAGPAVHYLNQTTDGHIWLVTRNGGVFEYDPASGGLRSYARLPGDEMNHVLADHENGLWIATSQGLYRIAAAAPGQPKHLRQVESPVFGTGNFFTVVSAPDGGIWCTGATGMFQRSPPGHGGRWQKISAGSTGLDPRMGDVVVNRDGSVWATDYGGGIVHIWIADHRMIRAEPVRAPTLASDQIVFLDAGPQGRLWVGGDHGVDIFNGRQWRRLSQSNGLLWNDLDLNAFASTREGAVWVGTSAGVSEVGRPAALFAPERLRAFITGASYNGHDLLQGGLPWARATLDINFTALGASSDAGLYYRYRLQGLESGWSYTSAGNARFPGIESGRYDFQIEAVDTEQHGRSPMVTAKLEIQPPWWRTVWALALAILIGLGLIWAALRGREKVLRSRQRALEALVEERTRELENEKRELEAARAELQVQATRDSLTGLWNRPAITGLMERELSRCSRENGRLGVVMVDLDHFKNVNDRLGHRCGDQVLAEAARRFRLAIRPYDGVGRWGGEEFLIILPGLAPNQGARRLETLRCAINAEPMQTDGGPVTLTCSFGVVWVRGQADWKVVLDEADQALYAAKRGGRDRIEHSSASA